MTAIFAAPIDSKGENSPTPASAHGTSVPTLKYLDCTATPSSWVTESYATIENVPRSDAAEAGAAPETPSQASTARLKAMLDLVVG